MSSNGFLAFLFFSSVLALIGCTHKNADPHQRHDSAPTKSEKILTPEEQRSLEKEGKFVDVTNLSKPEDIYAQGIAPYEKYLFDEKYLQNEKVAFSDKTRKMLFQMHLSILKLAELKAPQAEDVLNRYDKVIFSGCDHSLEGCQFLSVFAQDLRTSKVLALLAKRQGSIDAYFARVLAGFDVLNSEESPELVQLYLDRAPELLKHLRENSEKTSLIARHQRLMALLFKKNKSQPTQEELEKLDKLDPFSLSQSQENPFGALATEIFTYASKHRMYLADGSLSPALKRSIKANNEAGFAKLQEDLNKNSSQMMKSLKIELVNTEDEYFFLADLLFKGELALSEAMVFWQNSKQDSKKMVRALEGLTRVQMAQQILKSNQWMREFFSSRHVNDKLLEQAIHQSTTVSTNWKIFIRKSQTLGEFARAIFRTDARLAKYADETELFFGSLRRNIKFMVTYPHMMMMAYYMGKLEFKKNFETFIATVQIDSTRAIQEFFNGDHRPWFDYGTDDEYLPASKLKSLEILDAFQFALQTDAFSTFKIDVADFFKVITDKLLGPEILKLETELENITQKYDQSIEWGKILRLCDDLRNGRRYYNPLNILEFNRAPFMGRFYERLNNDFGGGNGGKDAASQREVVYQGYFFYSGRANKALDSIRIAHAPRLRYFETMLQIYEKYLAQIGLNAEQIKEKAAPIKANLERLKNVQRTYITKYYQRFHEFNSCYPELYKKDRAIQEKLFETEKEYLRFVHRELKRLRENPALAGEVNQALMGPDLPAKASVLVRASSDTFYLYQLDFFARLRKYLTEGFQAPDGLGKKMPPVDPQTVADIPGNLVEAPQFKQPMRGSVPFDEDVEKFVNMGLKEIAGNAQNAANPIVAWNQRYVNDSGHKRWRSGPILLYRLGSLVGTSGENLNISIEEILRQMRVSQEYLNYTSYEAQLFGSFASKPRIDLKVVIPEEFVDCHGNPKATFDYVLNQLGSDFMQETFDTLNLYVCQSVPTERSGPPSTWKPLLKEAEEFYIYQAADNKFVFDRPLDLGATLKPVYQQLIKTDQEKWFALYDSVVSEYEKDKRANTVLPFWVKTDKLSYPEYVSESVLRNYVGSYAQFARRTNDFFGPPPNR